MPSKNLIVTGFALLLLSGCGDNATKSDNNTTVSSASTEIVYNASELNSTQREEVVFMYNEEKLAKELYATLYTLYGTKTFTNISTRSETKHQLEMQTMLQRYDINFLDPTNKERSFQQSDLETVAFAQFSVDELQNLYDTLYAKAAQTEQDALEVGCMVEVTDVNDLTIAIADTEGFSLLQESYIKLRNGSYNHYHAFDSALKNLGVTQGCCTLGSEYCHDDYPKSSNAN